jgi:Holliday junction resolvasome RuvABC endonuclease subunit
VEDVFANPYRVAAFKSLLLMMDTLERIVNIKHGKRLHTIAPMAIKKIVADMGNADKMAVQEALLANEDITIRKPDLLTEHTSDAIGVAYAFSKKYLLNSI